MPTEEEERSRADRTAALASSKPVAGVTGPGRWLIAEYEPSALFSLKTSVATSSVGRSLVVPTPYAIKMAFVDAAFRAGLPDAGCADLLRSLVGVEARVAPPEAAVVTHTFVKVRQEPKNRSPVRPYISSIAYRRVELGAEFTQRVQNEVPWTLPTRAHIVILDDLGPEADLETLSSFTSKKPRRERHRRFQETIVPLGLVNTGPGFSEYRAR